MTFFVEVPPAALAPGEWDLACKAVRYGVAELDLPAQPALRWFREAARWLKSYDLTGFEHETSHPAGLMGRAEPYPDTVWLREGMSPSEELVTVFHELRHVAQGGNVTSKSAESERNEADAERWGRHAAQEFQSRPHATKSFELTIPTVTLARSGSVVANHAQPGLTDRTDLGDEMYPTRPLILNGWGRKADRIGAVTDVRISGFADDPDDPGHIWLRGQLDKHERYLRYIQRLVEQGAIDAKALVMDKHAARDSAGRLTRLPVVGVELRPQLAA